MDWLQDLLWNPNSVAHIVFLYAFVVAAGVYLGKIKIFGVSFGVTFVLFAGILMGHFGFTGDTHILHFIREFGLILFVFCIGLQVGPSFSSFKKGGMTLNMLAVGVGIEHCRSNGALFHSGRQNRAPHDGRYPVRCSHKHPGTRCRTSTESIELLRPADCIRLCLCLSVGSSRYHRLYHRSALHLPHQLRQRRRELESRD